MPDKFDYYKRWEYVSFLREFTKRGQKQSSTESEQLHFTTNSRRQYNTILWERFITSVQRPPNLLFQKKENRKESKQHGTPLSFWEKLSWLVYQFSKEFKSCFLHTPSTSLIETQACFVRKKKQQSFTSCYSSYLSDYETICIEHIRRASLGEMTYHTFLVKEKKVLTRC